MAIVVSCACGRRFQTADENAGRRARCPDCGQDLIIPKPEGDGDALLEPWDPGQPTVSGKSLASFVLGILSLFTCLLCGVPAIILGSLGLNEVKQSKGRLTGGWMATTGLILGAIGSSFSFVAVLIALLLPAVQSAREAARRAQCTNNLKQIALAMHNFESAYRSLPPAAITDSNGKPLLSWRVAILPFIEEQVLYEKFHLDEPWDSPNNLPLASQMPRVYACPSDVLPSDKTNYQVVVGPANIFTGQKKGVSIGEIKDGTSNTFLVEEMAAPIVWTQPDDPTDAQLGAGVLPMGSRHPGGFNVAFGDGSVKFIKNTVAASMIKAMLTRNGGETIAEP